MNVFTKGSFNRDVADVSDTVLLEALKGKIVQLKDASDISQVTGMKLLKGYVTHYRIKIVTKSTSFRMGVVVRGNTVWLVRFLSRKKIYQNFP